MNSCKQEFLNKGCMCLADPMDPYKTICAYINRESGLVYPCDTGCCAPRCSGQAIGPRFDVEIRPSSGVTLPPGFGGEDLAQSSEPTEIKGAAPFNTSPYGDGWKTEGIQDRKVWHLVMSGICVLLLIFIACWALE